jgi:hypothetical protein
MECVDPYLWNINQIHVMFLNLSFIGKPKKPISSFDFVIIVFLGNFQMIYLIYFINCSWVSTVQYTFTHKQYTEQHNETEYTEHNIHNNKNT